MKKAAILLSIALLTIMILSSSCNSSNESSASSNEVTIGTQVWMSENLKVDKFRNGDPIPYVEMTEEWNKAGRNSQPAWCYYDNDPTNGEKYGKLYNWYAVNDPRGLAPVGYHIASDGEWSALTEHLGDDAGTKMKSTDGWEENGNGNNSSGFSGFPGGGRYASGPFTLIGGSGYWWCSTEYYAASAWSRSLGYSNGNVFRGSNDKAYGLSVRCLKD